VIAAKVQVVVWGACLVALAVIGGSLIPEQTTTISKSTGYAPVKEFSLSPSENTVIPTPAPSPVVTEVEASPAPVEVIVQAPEVGVTPEVVVPELVVEPDLPPIPECPPGQEAQPAGDTLYLCGPADKAVVGQ
jgi:hypothetical protein